MGNETLVQRIDDTVVKMYLEDYKCDNANMQIYNAILYQFFMLRILATEMDKDGAYSQDMENVLQKSIETEKEATNVFMLIWNVRYAVFQMLEIVSLLADRTGIYLEEIQKVRQLFAENDDRAQNINQQIYYAADASYAMLSLISEILDETGSYSQIRNSIAEEYEKSNDNCSGIFQQAFCADRASFETLQLCLALVGGQSGISLAESIENRLNENYKIANGIFHDIIFVSQASVEALAFFTLGYVGEDISKFQLPNWKSAAHEQLPKEEHSSVSAPSAPKPQLSSRESTTPTAARSSNSSGGCYVATCVYGSYDCPEVWTLRRYRDDTLGTSWYGRLFVRVYYAVSPALVKWFGKTKWFKRLWRGKLDRMVAKLQSRGVESTPYNDKKW